MQKEILVAYASRSGSTAEVAQAVGEALREAGGMVDVVPVKKVSDLAPYGAVVVGSAIRVGRWLPEAVRFVQTHQEALSRMPTATFAVGMAVASEDEDTRRTAEAYLDPVRAIVQPAGEALFAGAMDYGRLPFVTRVLIKLIGIAEGDHRDWGAIRAWAGDLYPVLTDVSP
jgi:menaquinone-dependent protoporphyrinogen oxidase